MGGGPVESTLRAGADAAGLKLIETFALGSPRLALHRARMTAGAGELGWPFREQAFDRAVAAADPAKGERVRLTLDATGGFDLGQAPLPPNPAIWRLGLAQARLLSTEMAPPEEILLATDLPHVRLWVGNSLRGLMPALWQG